MKRLLSFIVLTLLILLTISYKANAHFLVTSDNGSVRAVVHVSPNDDPVSGQESVIYFDINSDQKIDKLVAEIIKDDRTTKVTPKKVGEKGVVIKYVFEETGNFKINLKVQNEDSQIESLSFDQFVNKGTDKHSTNQLNKTRAEPVLIISIIGILVVLILMYNRRKVILAYTKKLG